MIAIRRLWKRVTARAHAEAGNRPQPPAYPAWLEVQIHARKNAHPAAATPFRYSVISLVYERSEARYLEEAHASLRSQSLAFFEWIILAQGAIPPALDAVLARLASEPRIKILRSDVNLGIIRGMRLCLEGAQGDYIVPLDADDLLTEDALQLVDHSAHGAERPAFLYSDEDALISGVPKHPYLRPDWDPALNWSSSYIWHLCAFDRLTALEVDAFSDAGSEYCQDWDTVTRFANAGHRPHHIREVLYHWRQHEASSTNRATSNEAASGSLRSTRHLLERQIARLPHPRLYSVEQFPLFRGATEWHVARRHVAATPMDLIIFARRADGGLNALRAMLEGSDYPIASIVVVAQRALKRSEEAAYKSVAASTAARLHLVHDEGVAGLLNAARRTTASLITVCSDAVAVLHPEALWEALKLFELCDDTGLVCGRTTDRQGLVVQGAAVFGDDALPVFLDVGKRANDAGPYALLLKAHTVGMVHSDFFVAAGDFLRHAGTPPAASPAGLGMWLGAMAAAARRRVAYSPLTTVEVHSKVVGLTSAQQLGRAEQNSFLAEFRTTLPTSRLSAQQFIASGALFH